MKNFWAYELAESTLSRHNPPYFVSDWKTPSGYIHVGALRGVLLHDAVSKTIRLQAPVRYVYGFDDFDSMDKLPSYLDSSFEKYLGQSFSTIPAPNTDLKPKQEVSETDNYARFFADEFEGVYRSLGVESETLYTSKLYREGFFNDAIRIALDEALSVKAAYENAITERHEGRTATPFKKFPINMVCEKCHKIATTEALEWDGNEVAYHCQGINFAQGCDYKGKASPLNGGAKLPWKVEWAAKFYSFRTDLEGAGKDHYTKGGSRDVASEIFRAIYQPKLPKEYAHLPVDLFYEWLLIDGKKMSTSKGVGDTAKSVSQLLPANVLRFLLVRSKPRSSFSFELNKDSALRLYDQFDQYRVNYLEKPETPEAQAFKLSLVEEDVPEFTMKLSSIVYLLQLPRTDLKKIAFKEKGDQLTDIELKELASRQRVAEKIISELGDSEKITLQETLPEVQLDSIQKQFFNKLFLELKNCDWTGEVIHKIIHEVRKTAGIDPKQAFAAIYLVFLNQASGPQAGWFLANLERDFVLTRLKDSCK